MDLLSLRDLPLALAFGIVCLWFYNQANIEFGKKYLVIIDTFNKENRLLIQSYEGLVTSLIEERRQWITDQRTERAFLLDTITKNTEALTKNANETHQLRGTLTPLVLVAERYAKEILPRDKGNSNG